MRDSAKHVGFDELNDYVDGRLGSERRSAILHHLTGCDRCRREHDSLRAVLAAASGLPRQVLPEHDIWPDLRLELERERDAVLPLGSDGKVSASTSRSGSIGRSHDGTQWRGRGWLAAAAVVLVVASSAVTAVVLRSGPGGPGTAVVGSPGGAPEIQGASVSVLPIGFRVAEDEYVRAIGELRGAVDAQRHLLDPSTVATVERSLAVVDSAIAEARGALLRDPNNTALVDLLSASYQRKLDLLRRASELNSRI